MYRNYAFKVPFKTINPSHQSWHITIRTCIIHILRNVRKFHESLPIFSLFMIYFCMHAHVCLGPNLILYYQKVQWHNKKREEHQHYNIAECIAYIYDISICYNTARRGLPDIYTWCPRAHSTRGRVCTYQANPNMLCYNKYISHSVLAHFSSFSSLSASDSICFVQYKTAKTQPIYRGYSTKHLFAHLLLYKHQSSF